MVSLILGSLLKVKKLTREIWIQLRNVFLEYTIVNIEKYGVKRNGVQRLIQNVIRLDGNANVNILSYYPVDFKKYLAKTYASFRR